MIRCREFGRNLHFTTLISTEGISKTGLSSSLSREGAYAGQRNRIWIDWVLQAN